MKFESRSSRCAGVISAGLTGRGTDDRTIKISDQIVTVAAKFESRSSRRASAISVRIKGIKKDSKTSRRPYLSWNLRVYEFADLFYSAFLCKPLRRSFHPSRVACNTRFILIRIALPPVVWTDWDFSISIWKIKVMLGSKIKKHFELEAISSFTCISFTCIFGEGRGARILLRMSEGPNGSTNSQIVSYKKNGL